MLDEILHEYSLSEYGNIKLIQSLLTQFFIYLYRSLVRNKQEDKNIKHNNTTVSSCTLDKSLPNDNKRSTQNKKHRDYKIETFFQDNIAKSLKVEDIAEELHLSIKQTNRILKDFYGYTFKQKLIGDRLSEATQLLHNGILSIDEIVECIGYKSKTGFFYSILKSIAV